MLAAGLIGAILLVVADSFIRLIPTMTELKLGVLTAFLGVPLLLLLLRRPSSGLLSED
jgi:iron complex transport system permease protein